MTASVRRASTLAEVALGVAIFSLFVLGLIGVLGRSVHLSRRGREIEQAHQLTQSYLERLISQAREPEGYLRLASIGLSQSYNPDYLYSVDISEVQPGLRRLCVRLYHHDPHGTPLAVDTRRVHQGLAICLGTVVNQP